jgi:hypothetical protein
MRRERMPTMRTRDAVHAKLALEMGELGPVRAAFLTSDDSGGRQLHFWTLLDSHDEPTERRLVHIESEIEHQFSDDVDFTFTTIHLRGRDPRALIPDDALLVKTPA